MGSFCWSWSALQQFLRLCTRPTTVSNRKFVRMTIWILCCLCLWKMRMTSMRSRNSNGSNSQITEIFKNLWNVLYFMRTMTILSGLEEFKGWPRKIRIFTYMVTHLQWAMSLISLIWNTQSRWEPVIDGNLFSLVLRQYLLSVNQRYQIKYVPDSVLDKSHN